MQTFLPFDDFVASAAALDPARLGKQRVEVLQILRALVLPAYGWQRHPAVTMWRGHVLALTAYGLAVTDAWRDLGRADGVRDQLLEFAPEVDGRAQRRLAAEGALPVWLGDPALHESHRSKLIEKDPAHYGPRFPGTPVGLDYVWPPGPPAAAVVVPPHGLLVVRLRSLDPWRDLGSIGLPAAGPRGVTAGWQAQLDDLEQAMRPGGLIGAVADDGPRRIELVEITGASRSVVLEDAPHLVAPARFTGAGIARDALPVPALLQDPRRCFRIALPRPVDAVVAGAGGSTG